MEILVRNAPCPCGSGRKYKRCHGLEMPKSYKERGENVPSVYKPFPPRGISSWGVGGMVEGMKRVSRQ
jgi:hypothetical protein